MNKEQQLELGLEVVGRRKGAAKGLNTRIEIAKPSDIPLLASFAFDTYNTFDSEIPEPYMARVLSEVTEVVRTHVSFVCKDDNDKVLGAILLKFTPLGWWTTEIGLASLLVYVRPEYRANGIAKKLIESAKEFAKDSNVDLAIGVMGGKSLKGKERLLENSGLTKYDSIYKT